MKSTSTKLLAFASVLAIGVATSGAAKAQVEPVTATLTTSSAITSTKTSDMDFGTWLIQFVAGTPALTLTDDGTVATTQTGALGGSLVVQVTAPATEGVLDVQIPAAGALTAVVSNFVDIADAGLSLQDVTYRTATENGAIVALAAATAAVPVTVLAGLTDETFTMGGTIDITATPADLAHTATFDVTFAY